MRPSAASPGHSRQATRKLRLLFGVRQSRSQFHLPAAHRARALRQLPPSKMPRAQGRPGAGWHPRSAVRKCAGNRCTAAYRAAWTSGPSLRSGLTAYVALSPGSDALLPPSPCRWLMCGPGRAVHITARLGAQAPGARTTRFCRTQAAPVVCARVAAHGVTRPAITFAPTPPASTTSHPAFVTIAIRPSAGLGWSKHAIIPNSRKAKCFDPEALTKGWRVLPAGRRKGLWFARNGLRSRSANRATWPYQRRTDVQFSSPPDPSRRSGLIASSGSACATGCAVTAISGPSSRPRARIRRS